MYGQTWCEAGGCMCIGHYVVLRGQLREAESRLVRAESALQKVRGSLEGIQEVLFDADIRTSGSPILPTEALP